MEGKPVQVHAPAGQFRASRSAAEMAMMDAEGYADAGLAEHKSAGGKHLEEHWRKGRGGLRPEGEDYEEEQERLHELERRSVPGAAAGGGLVQRAKEMVGGAMAVMAAMAGSVVPGRFKASKSAAELAYGDAEGYADSGLAEHKGAPGKHLEGHWRKGYGGLRPDGEDREEEEERLRELQRKSQTGVVQRAKDTVSSTAAAATERASDVLQAAKEMVGLEPKK